MAYSAQGSESLRIRNEKNALRQKYKSLRTDISTDAKLALDQTICHTTVSLASFRYADTVLMYAPTGTEIDIFPIATFALQCGKKVAFPRCLTESHSMDFKYVTSLDELTKGEYSILEPPANAISVTDFSHSICIVPGLVFDNSGYRVGYGKGYYDRFLSTYRETKLGLVYSDFIIDQVPRGMFDRRVDIIVSEKGVKLATVNS